MKKLFGKKELSGKNENEIFSNAKVPFVIPEMREDEFLSVKTKKLKANSDLDLKEFKGLLHWHTTWSDGRDTLETMLNEAVRLNFRYIAVCDHSKSAAYANGLKEERILLQKEQLGKIQEQYKIKLFQGIESDILADGSLDYPQEFLPNL
jgi:DNA polymerase (family 10)